MINAFPSKTSISDTISPTTIVESKPKLDISRPKIYFSSHALVYTQTTNNIKSKVLKGIDLRASNSAGGHIMILYSGRRIHGYTWNELPIDKYVIDRVESLEEDEEQHIMHKGTPSFEWTPGEDIQDELDAELEHILHI